MYHTTDDNLARGSNNAFALLHIFHQRYGFLERDVLEARMSNNTFDVRLRCFHFTFHFQNSVIILFLIDVVERVFMGPENTNPS